MKRFLLTLLLLLLIAQDCSAFRGRRIRRRRAVLVVPAPMTVLQFYMAPPAALSSPQPTPMEKTK